MPPQKCCCCFSLKTGSKIIGFWSMIGTPFYIYGITSLNQKIIYVISYITPISGVGMSTDYYMASWQNIENTLLALIIFKALYFLSSILLLVGIFKNNPGLMMPWLIAEPMRQLIYFAFASCCIWISINIFGLATVNSSSPLIAIPISVSIAALIFMGLAFYYWRIVKAVRDEMHESRNKVISNDSPYYEDDENTVPVIINNLDGNVLGEQYGAVLPQYNTTQNI